MKKYYVSGIVIIVLIVGTYVYLRNGNHCYDGYGSGLYVAKNELITKLDSAGSGPNDLNIAVSQLNEIAFESYRCGDTSYSIREGDTYKEVSQANLQKFISERSVELVKITQIGNSPYFVNDIPTGKKYFIDLNDGKYVLKSR